MRTPLYIDCLCLILQCFLQFGMLIEFLFEQFPQWENETELPIKDLEVYHMWSIWCVYMYLTTYSINPADL